GWSMFKDGFVIINLVFFIVVLISAFFSDNIGQGLKFVERNVSFLMVPVIFSLIKHDRRGFDINKMFRKYIALMAILALVALFVAFYKNHLFNMEQGQPFYKMKSWFFTYHYLAQNVNCTAIYFSLYLGFAFVLLILDITGVCTIYTRNKYTTKMACIVFLGTILLLLSARTIMATVFLITIIVVGTKAIRVSKIPTFLLALVTTGLVGIAIIKSNDVLRLRVESIFSKK